MICPTCSKHNNDDVRYCRHCGEQIERRTCQQGHTIPEGLSECPYCPKKAAAVPSSTAAAPPSAAAAPPPTDTGERKRTVVVSEQALVDSGVQPSSSEAPVLTAGLAPAVGGLPGPRRKGTVVVMPPSGDSSEASPAGPVAQVGGASAVATRGASPLAGFVVSFSIDRNGVFWPLRYGRTRIGSSPDADVCLSHPEISGEHAMIIVRDNKGSLKIWCEDSGSQNGTCLNGADIFNERPDLKTGDVVKVGPVEMKLVLLD